MKKITKRDIFIFILGLILSGSIVYAATIIARDITYDNTKTNINADNVQDAIDALYTKASNSDYFQEDIYVVRGNYAFIHLNKLKDKYKYYNVKVGWHEGTCSFYAVDGSEEKLYDIVAEQDYDVYMENTAGGQHRVRLNATGSCDFIVTFHN